MKNGKLHLIYGSLLGLSLGSHFVGPFRSDADPKAAGADHDGTTAVQISDSKFPQVNLAAGPGTPATSGESQRRPAAENPDRASEQLEAVRKSNQQRADQAIRSTMSTGPNADILLGGGDHGIIPERVVIEKIPTSVDAVSAFLPGTVWSWAKNAEDNLTDLGQYVVFLSDGTMLGSWGVRYEYSVDKDLSLQWWRHRSVFSADFQGIMTEGTYPRVGRLLRRMDRAELDAVRQTASTTDIVRPDDGDKGR